MQEVRRKHALSPARTYTSLTAGVLSGIAVTCSVVRREAKFSFVSSKYSSIIFSMAIDVVTSQVKFSHHLHTRVIGLAYSSVSICFH